MNVDAGKQFLQKLGITTPIDKGDGWISGPCPLARWTHQSGKDNNPSFAIHVGEGQRTYFNCFTCRKGGAEELLQVMELYSKDSEEQYDFAGARLLLQLDDSIVPLPEYGTVSVGQTFEEWPYWWLESFAPVTFFSDAMKYLESRNVSGETIHQFDLRYDTTRSMIVAPFWDVQGRLAGARGRSILQNAVGSHKHFDYHANKISNTKLVWYNEVCLNEDGPVVAVEGQFDVWRTVQAWKKTVGNLTALPTQEKMRKLSYSSCLVHLTDNDKTGDQSAEKFEKICNQLHIPYLHPKLHESVKDPDQCHPEYLKELIESTLIDAGMY